MRFDSAEPVVFRPILASGSGFHLQFELLLGLEGEHSLIAGGGPGISPWRAGRLGTKPVRDGQNRGLEGQDGAGWGRMVLAFLSLPVCL